MKFKFRTIVNQQHKVIYSMALHMLGDSHEAEDVTQETYERLWHNIHAVETETAKYWLLRVARNLCIDRLRKHRETEQANELLICHNWRNDPEAQAIWQQLSIRLKTAITALKEPYLTLIVMADLQQRSIKEIVIALHLKENQVKVYIHRARKQLQTLLNGDEL